METEQLKKIIESKEWYKWGARRITTRLAECWGDGGVKNFKIIWGHDFPDQLMLLEDVHGGGYFDNGQFIEMRDYLLREIMTKGFYGFYERKATLVFKDTLLYGSWLKKTKLQGLSNKKLSDIFSEFITKESRMMHYLWIIFIFDQFLPDFFSERLNIFLGKISKSQSFLEIIRAVNVPFKQADVLRERADLIKAAIDARDDFGKLDKWAKLLARKYAYFPILNYDEVPYDEAFFKKEISKLLRDRSIIRAAEQTKIFTSKIKKNYKKFLKLASSEKELLRLGEACHRIAYYRDYRNEVRRKLGWFAQDLYKEIAGRLGISTIELLMFKKDEIVSSLASGRVVVKKADLDQRMQGSIFFNYGKKFYSFFGKDSLNSIRSLVEKEMNSKEFKGISAFQGLVRAKAKIVMSVHRDGAKLKQGDVLVTSMTNLDFLALMSKAAAVVTDEGSLLCHAAIVAREMKKPCIVGAKIATKILKDGMKVEVDANKGIVKIIK